jgi:integrase
MLEVIPSDIKRVYSVQYKGLSNSYIRSAKQLYCALFDSALADRVVQYNPARDKSAKPHKGNKPKERVLTPQQREWIETLCTDHRTYPAVMAMLYAGIRPQEAKAIDIDRDVDFTNDFITVRETAHISTENGQRYAYTGEGKTEWSNRRVPLLPPLKQALNGKHGYLITSAHGERVTIQTWKTAWSSYLFCMETAINGIQKRWYGRTKEQRAKKEAGTLPAWINFDIVPYTLRHAFCQMCRDSGVELNTCRRWMGHADTQMILRVYDAVSDDRSEQEREKVEKRLIGVQNGVQKENGEPGMVEE